MEKFRLKLTLNFVILFIIFLLIHLFFNSPLNSTISTPDSISYRFSPSLVQAEPYFGPYALESLSKIDLFGRSLRPWPFNLISQNLPSDFGITIFLVLLSALASSILTTYIISNKEIGKWNRIYLVVITIIFFASPKFLNWHKFILTESFVNSLALILISLVLILNSLKDYKKTVYFLQFLIYFVYLIVSIQRPLLGIAFIPLMIFYTLKKSLKQLLKIGLTLIIIIIYTIVLNLNMSNTWLNTLGTTIPGTTFSHLSDTREIKSENYINFVRQYDLPECLINNNPNEINAWQFSRTFKINCPKGIEWLDKNFSTTYALYLIQSDYFVKEIIYKLQESFHGVNYLQYYLSVNDIKLTIFNFFEPVLWSGNNLIFWTKICIIFLVFLLYMFNRKVIDKKIAFQIKFLFTIIGICLIHVILTRIFMPSDPGRLGYPSSIIFNLSFFYFLPYLLKLIKIYKFN